MKWYGWAGVGLILIAALLWIYQTDPYAVWITPTVWWGYILFIDNIIFAIKGDSLVSGRTKEFLFQIVFSIGFWLVFEAYNLHLANWEYVGLPATRWIRYLGYGVSFATIMPGLFETTELVELLPAIQKLRMKPVRFIGNPRSRHIMLGAGILCMVGPLLVSRGIAQYLFGFVWIGFLLAFDPINYRLGIHSLLRDWETGVAKRTVSLGIAGIICGIIWEFWNYRALGKWIYIFPVMQEVKIFEMPLPGYLGFVPFAMEYYIMYRLVIHVLNIRSFQGVPE